MNPPATRPQQVSDSVAAMSDIACPWSHTYGRQHPSTSLCPSSRLVPWSKIAGAGRQIVGRVKSAAVTDKHPCRRHCSILAYPASRYSKFVCHAAEADAATMLLKKNVYQGLDGNEGKEQIPPLRWSGKLRAHSALHAWSAPRQLTRRSEIEQFLDR